MFISIFLAKARMTDQSECPLGDSWLFSKYGKCLSTGTVLRHKKGMKLCRLEQHGKYWRLLY